MSNVTFSVDEDLYKRMKSHPEIKWSEVCRQAIIKFLEETEHPTIWSTKMLRSRLSSPINQLIKSLPVEKTGDFAVKSREYEKKRAKHLYNEEKLIENSNENSNEDTGDT